MHEKLLRLCFFAERCVILEVNKIRQPPGCSKGVNEIMKEYAFGIDLGGTTAKVGLFTTSGKLLEKWEVSTDTSNNGAHILENLAAAVQQKMQEKGLSADEVEGVGLGVPGPVLDSSIVPIVCANLGGWGNRNVSIELSELLGGIRVLVGNDANVAALGEFWKGGGQGCDNMVFVTLGTGVGGGIVVEGKLLHGAHGSGAEIGHLVLNRDETVPCNCGKRGCVEQYCSATGIVHLAKRHLDSTDAPSSLRTLKNLTCKDIFDAGKAGDKEALIILDRYYAYMGEFLGDVCTTVDPEVVVIGGGVSKAGQVLIDGILPYFHKYVFHAASGARFTLASLGNDAGAYGAFKLALDAFHA